MSERFFTKEFPNGLTLLGQPMDQVASAAMTVILPAGAAYDPADAAGAAAVGVEWCLRGAGERNTRQLNDALDSLGCEHQENILSEHMHFAASLLGRNLADALKIYADILRRPRLEDATFGPCRDLTLQDLDALEDEPAQKCNIMLRENFYPYPLGRCALGSEESLKKLSADGLRRHLAGRMTPAGAVMTVAGNFDWPALCGQVEELFGDWQGAAPQAAPLRPPAAGVTHIAKETAQAHIALAHKAVTIADSRYYAARMAEMVLSGGMSSRLFTEVREKRGLVYHVSTRYHSLKNHAGMFTYAGTRPELAQQTFDVTVGELRRLAEGIALEEMARARIQLKSSLIMQGESTSARANALATDWYHLHRLRTLQEISDTVAKVTVDDVLAYLREFPARDFTVLIIGPKSIDTTSVDR